MLFFMYLQRVYTPAATLSAYREYKVTLVECLSFVTNKIELKNDISISTCTSHFYDTKIYIFDLV